MSTHRHSHASTTSPVKPAHYTHTPPQKHSLIHVMCLTKLPIFKKIFMQADHTATHCVSGQLQQILPLVQAACFHCLGSLFSHLCANSLQLQYCECSSEPEIEGPGAPKPPIVTSAVPASSSKEQEAIKTCT